MVDHRMVNNKMVDNKVVDTSLFGMSTKRPKISVRCEPYCKLTKRLALNNLACLVHQMSKDIFGDDQLAIIVSTIE